MTRLALLSVFAKDGLVDFARELEKRGFSLLSTGGSARALREAGFNVRDVAELTGFPEMLGGRVKTLHPVVHGGILARREEKDDLETLARHGIERIDLVCVNLYPFEKVLAEGADPETMVEMIDIGGPAMLRSAAKNHRHVTVVASPQDYPLALAALDEQDPAKALERRRELARRVFARCSRYDALIAGWFSREAERAAAAEEREEATDTPAFPAMLKPELELVSELRYGENPHQRGAFYRFAEVSGLSLAAAEQLQGKQLSYNNLQDGNAALELLREFERPCVLGLKHMNPCGLGVADSPYEAWKKAYAADPVSIFGGIVACNREVSAEMAAEMTDIFLEFVVAPSYSPEALEHFRKKPNLRVLRLSLQDPAPRHRLSLKSVNDGILVQDLNLRQVRREDCHAMGAAEAKESDWQDLLEAFSVVKHCKSNAIVLYRDGMTVGIGVGQSNRVGAARLAIAQAGDKARGAVLASDAFFPMPDTMELAVAAGVRAVIQPGGSIRDKDSVAVCDQAGIPMIATGIRHFKH